MRQTAEQEERLVGRRSPSKSKKELHSQRPLPLSVPESSSSYRGLLSAPASPSPSPSKNWNRADKGRVVGGKGAITTVAKKLSGAASPGSGFTNGVVYALNSSAAASRGSAGISKPLVNHRMRSRREGTGSSASASTGSDGNGRVKTTIFRGKPPSTTATAPAGTDTKGSVHPSMNISGSSANDADTVDGYYCVDVGDTTGSVEGIVDAETEGEEDPDPDESTGTVIALNFGAPPALASKDMDASVDDVKGKKRDDNKDSGSPQPQPQRQRERGRRHYSQQRPLQGGRERGGGRGREGREREHLRANVM